MIDIMLPFVVTKSTFLWPISAAVGEWGETRGGGGGGGGREEG